MNDSECIARCVAGERDLFRVLVERYQGPALAYARGRLRGADAAEEVVQEAFVRAYQKLRRLEKRTSFFGWLIGISNHVIQEGWRESSRQRQLAEEANRLRMRKEVREEGWDLELDEAVAALEEPYRDVVLLRYYGELSCAEVGDRLGMPLGSVTKVLSRAYAMLRAKLAPDIENRQVGVQS